MKEKNSNKVIGGLAWTFGERICAQMVSTLVAIILARVLDPEHYGIISIVTVFVTLLNVFVSGGLGSALVQKKDADELDFNTAFLVSLFMAVTLYTCLFLCAPYIANFYEMPLLAPVIRVMGVRLIIASINNIQQAYIRRRMEFKKFFWATFIGTVISGVFGVVFAYIGFGVWALVVQYLINVGIDTLMLFRIGTWKPRVQFSLERAKRIWSFGWKVLATELVYTLEGDIRSLIVGKVFGSADLAYYDQGRKYPALLVTNINSSIEKVMLPAFSKQQDNLDILLSALRKAIRIGLFLLAPILVGFAVVSESFVSLILTDKWLFCVPYMQIFCIAYLARPLGSSCHQALLAVGKSGTVLICMLAVNTFSVVSIFISVFILKSVLWLAVFSLATETISFLVFLGFTNKYIGYKVRYQLVDVLPSLLISVFMGCIVWLFKLIPVSGLLLLISQIIFGAVIYILLNAIFKVDAFVFFRNFLKNFINNRK